MIILAWARRAHLTLYLYMENTETAFWRKCNSCKKPIAFGARYYVCSVSTCNGQRTGYVFCTVPCFEMHLPGARHKDAAAIESKAPMSGASAPAAAAGQEPKRTIIKSAAGVQSAPRSQMPRETLIIASRLKEYIHARAEMNTSAGVIDVLSDFVRIICDRATDNARADGRKTVLDRDFEFLKKSNY
jgi:histone H3/H4